MSRMVVSGGDTPFITNSSNPKGGVVKLISKASNMMSPNHTRSKPRDCANGKNIGTVSNIIEICSMNMPSNNNTANITANMAIGSRSKPVAQVTKPLDAPENASN